jgi:hypothetical protein
MILASLLTSLLAGVAGSAELEKPLWSAAVLGNDDVLTARIGYQPLERTTVGWYGCWRDDVAAADDTVEAWGVGVFATYATLEDAPFHILTVDVPVTQYFGVQAGPLWARHEEPQATAGLMAGVRFGDAVAGLGCEYQFTLDRSVWDKLADVTGASQVLVSVELRWR